MVTVMVEWVTLMSRSRTDRPASGSSLAMASRRVSHAHTAIQSSVLVLGTNGASRTPGTARKTLVEDSEVVEVVQGEVAPVAVEVVAEAVAVVALAPEVAADLVEVVVEVGAQKPVAQRGSERIGGSQPRAASKGRATSASHLDIVQSCLLRCRSNSFNIVWS